MTRVAFVCQWYAPEPVAVPVSIATALNDAGCPITVLTGVPNFPEGQVHDGYSASRASRETVGGLPVRRTPLYASHDASAVRRLANYGSWAISSAVAGQRELRNADVSLVYSSPATAALAPMLARCLWGTPYVLLIQDLWPDSVFASGLLPGLIGKVTRKVLTAFVQLSYRGAEHVVVISPGMADLLEDRGVPREKISLVYNWLPAVEPSASVVGTGRPSVPSLRERFAIPADERVFLYAGNHGLAQGLETLLDAFIDQRTAPAHLVMLGGGVCKDDLVARAAGHPRVHFHDRVDRDEAMALVGSADVHVVSLADRPLFAVTMPSKVQAGLASGQPMLVVGTGDPAALVEENRAGRAARPADVESVVGAVQALLLETDDELAAMGERGRQAYRGLMSCEVGVPALRTILESAARRRGRKRSAAPSSNERNNT